MPKQCSEGRKAPTAACSAHGSLEGRYLVMGEDELYKDCMYDIYKNYIYGL